MEEGWKKDGRRRTEEDERMRTAAKLTLVSVFREGYSIEG